jgi:hypothetical protein
MKNYLNYQERKFNNKHIATWNDQAVDYAIRVLVSKIAILKPWNRHFNFLGRVIKEIFKNSGMKFWLHWKQWRRNCALWPLLFLHIAFRCFSYFDSIYNQLFCKSQRQTNNIKSIFFTFMVGWKRKLSRPPGHFSAISRDWICLNSRILNKIGLLIPASSCQCISPNIPFSSVPIISLFYIVSTEQLLSLSRLFLSETIGSGTVI